MLLALNFVNDGLEKLLSSFSLELMVLECFFVDIGSAKVSPLYSLKFGFQYESAALKTL